MQCPKDKTSQLVADALDGELKAQRCPECAGVFIAADDYLTWQTQHGAGEVSLPTTPFQLEFAHSPLDDKAALCPQCSHYLSRARVSLPDPFYIERCANCGGIWCDKGEWEALEKLGLNTAIQQLFSSRWQARVREAESAAKERQLMIDKLGPDLAEQVFQMVESLQAHPDGYFGVAYLMRRFDRHSS